MLGSHDFRSMTLRRYSAAVAFACVLGCNPGTAEIPPGYVTGPCVAGDCLGGGVCLSDVCVDPNGLEDDGSAAADAASTAQGSTVPGSEGAGDDAGDDAGNDAGDDATTPGASGSAEGSDASGEPQPTADGGTETGEPCNLFTQDCGPGLKCNPTSEDGITWTGICIDVAPDPSDPGEPCMVLGGELEGLDDCAIGSVCAWTEGDALGVCSPLCLGAAPPDGGCLEDDAWCFDVGLPLCLDTCDPLAPSCGVGWGCYLGGELFACVPDQSGSSGSQGQPCQVQNDCDPSRVCVLAEFDAQCVGPSCCANVCDLDAPICAPGRECVDLFNGGPGDAVHPDVGVCVNL